MSTGDVDRPTIADAARLSGVSAPTVSKVLNGSGHVAEATRTRVLAALDEVGYVSRRSRDVRRSVATGYIQLVAKNIQSPFLLRILDGAHAEARRAGLGLIVTSADPASSGQWLVAHKSASSNVAGTLFVSPDEDDNRASERASLVRPIVVLEPKVQPPPGVLSVSTANWHGGMQAMEHLLALGHTRIGMIAGTSSLYSKARIGSYVSALETNGIELDGQLMRRGDFSVASGRREGLALLDLNKPPTAIFAASDEIAFGVVSAARERGVGVPEELSVVGFDDIPEASWMTPALTTVRQPLEQLALLAVQALARRDLGDFVRSDHIELSTELIVRDSTQAR
jgi:DNA-binding LacI/PurR family transcriptional regulator